MPTFRFRHFKTIALVWGGVILGFMALSTSTHAQSVPITATVLGAPPTTQAVIIQPTNGQVFSTTPLVVNGTCGPDLLVRVFNNGQLAGSITCSVDGDFIVNVTLQVGQNVLTAFNYDAQEQPGPDSPAVTISVVLPTPETPLLPSGVINDDGIVDTSDTKEETPAALESENGQPSEQQYLFEDTFIEPITKAFGLHSEVAPQTNKVVAAVLNGAFIATVTIPVLVLSCFKLGWLSWLKWPFGPKL